VSEILDVPGAAKLLGLTERSIRARVARHQLPFRRLGGRIIFRRAELLDFLEKLDGVGLGEALANATREGVKGEQEDP
jgi:excisionase family DNA binding protein